MPYLLRVDIDQCCRHAHHDDQKVRHAQIDQEKISRVPHVLVSPNHENDQRIAHDSQQEYDDIDHRGGSDNVRGGFRNCHGTIRSVCVLITVRQAAQTERVRGVFHYCEYSVVEAAVLFCGNISSIV